MNKPFGKEEYISVQGRVKYGVNEARAHFVKYCPLCHEKIYLDREQLYELCRKAKLKVRLPIQEHWKHIKWPRIYKDRGKVIIMLQSYMERILSEKVAQLEMTNDHAGQHDKIIEQLKLYERQIAGRGGLKRLLELRKDGHSLRAVSQEMGISHEWVRYLEKLCTDSGLDKGLTGSGGLL